MIWSYRETEVSFDEVTKSINVTSPAGVWKTDASFEPWISFICNDEIIQNKLSDAGKITVSEVKSGTGRGVCVRYAEFPSDKTFSMDTIWWLEKQSGLLYAWTFPVQEGEHCIDRIAWPAPFEFKEMDEKNITVFPLMQGILIPNGWNQTFDLEDHWELEANQTYTRSAYMPWWGQIRGNQGYMAIAQTPWDAGFHLEHPAGGATAVSLRWNSSLGKLSYGRCVRFEFMTNCTYVTMCKHYRAWIQEIGRLCTLNEKILRNSTVQGLIGTSIIHTVAWLTINPTCKFATTDNEEPFYPTYDATFAQRAAQIERLHQLGLEHAYVHVDGWGHAGYDAQHPDVLPPAERTGGWDGLEDLQKRTRDCGFMFALHDQYRDYYLDAPSYDPNLAIHDRDGNIPTCDLWVGGVQAYLCPSQSLQFLRKNYMELIERGLKPDGVYLDVFACVGLDECWSKEHPVTRRQCMEHRESCFEWMRSHGIAVSSEEGIGWAMHSLDLVHHASYALVNAPKEGTLCGECTGVAYGIPVPLLNLVYHDCVVIPWCITEQSSEVAKGENPFLHAILNGGVPYVDIEATKEEIEQAKIVSELHKKIGTKEMISHSFVEGTSRQRTVFDGGVTVEVDFLNNTYQITE